MKKIFSVILIAVMLVISAFSASSAAAKIANLHTIYVNSSAPSGGDGSQSHPFKTISQAVNTAQDGDTIQVAPGIYSENVIINKKLTLNGAKAGIDPCTGDWSGGISEIDPAPANNYVGIFIETSGVIVNGFKINGGWQGIHVSKDVPVDSSRIAIENNIITGYSSERESEVNISEVGIPEGIRVDGGNVLITHNIIQSNETGAPDPNRSLDSIYIKGKNDTVNVEISYNVLRNNKFSGKVYFHLSSASGISLHEHVNAVIIGNEIYNNNFGIHVEPKKHNNPPPPNPYPTVTVHYNNIYDNQYDNDNLGNSNLQIKPRHLKCGFIYEERGTPNPPNQFFDVAYNWWGETDKSGPHSDTTEPGHLTNPNGTGDGVCDFDYHYNYGNCNGADFIKFSPWVDKVGDKTEGPSEGVTGGNIEANSLLAVLNPRIGLGADAYTNSSGPSNIMLVKYIGNPTNVPLPESFSGSFYDLNTDHPENMEHIILKLYYPGVHKSLTPFWFNKADNKWEKCSNWQVVGTPLYACDGNYNYAGYVAVRVDNSTIPSLSELTGTYFTLGGYTVTFNSEGGSAVPSQTVPYGGKVTKTADPTKAGYTFAEWYTDETYTTTWDFDNDTVTSNITLYAKWTINEYTIDA